MRHRKNKQYTRNKLKNRLELIYRTTLKYKDKEYFVLNEYNYVAVCDENYTEEYEVYANEMEFIENFKIDGKPLIELIDKLEEVDPM